MTGKILGGVALATIAALAVLWRVYVTAPSPTEVCAHIIQVTVQEAGEQAMAADTQDTLLERLKEQCVRHKRDKIQLRGKIEYASHAKCVMAAGTLRDIEGC